MSAPEYLTKTVDLCLKNKENCFMFYLGAPQNTHRVATKYLNIEQCKKELINNDIDINNVVIHLAYIINAASGDKVKRDFARDFIKKEIAGAYECGITKVVLHPGNAVGISKEEAIANCIDTINKVNEFNKGVTICIETMSGKGTEICANFKEIKQVIDGVKNKKLIGVCFDTCHVWDSGYDLSDVDQVFNEFDKEVGLEWIKIIHLNDSENIKGSKKDRHANIGYGKIGFDNLINVAYYKPLENVPKILETPMADNWASYGKEIECIKNKKFVDWIK